MTPINISAIRHSAFYSPLLYAIGSGLLKKEGLEPHYALATPDKPVPERLRSGELHVSQSSIAVSFAELEKGITPDIVHFAIINLRDGFFLASRHAMENFQWKQLEGREVLVDHFFQPLAMLKYVCHVKRVDYSAIRVIDAGDVNAIEAAYRSGRGEFVHLQGPAPQQMEHEGIAHVVASVGEAIGPIAFSSLYARREWLQTDMARAFMRAYRASCKAVVELPASEIAAVVQTFLPQVNRDVLIKTISTYQRLGTWSREVEIPKLAYEKLLDVFLYSGLITKRHPYTSAIARVSE